MPISLDRVNEITWLREQYCSQEHVLFTTPPKLSVIFYVFGSALCALPLGLVMERVFGVTVQLQDIIHVIPTMLDTLFQ